MNMDKRSRKYHLRRNSEQGQYSNSNMGVLAVLKYLTRLDWEQDTGATLKSHTLYCSWCKNKK